MKKRILTLPLLAGALIAAPTVSAEASAWLRARQLAHLQSNGARLASLWIEYAFGDPSFDPTNQVGAVDCRANQPAPHQVTVLTGAFGGTVTRACEVPARTPLFFPVLNDTFFNTDIPVPCTQDAECAFVQGTCNAAGTCQTGYTVEDKVEIIEKYLGVDDQCDLRVWLDGDQIYPAAASIPLLRAHSEPTTAPHPGTGFVDHETMAGGNWALVPGLAPGPHTLQFAGKTRGADGACGSEGAFSLDVTYELDVQRKRGFGFGR